MTLPGHFSFGHKGRGVGVLIAVAVVALGLTVWGQPWRTVGTANELQAIQGQPTPGSFDVPVPISWPGVISRTLAGGRGLEVKSQYAPSGYFFTYWEDDRVAPIMQGSIRVQGNWLGVSCEYGRCAPEVHASSVQSENP